jgi:hypothetical protein
MKFILIAVLTLYLIVPHQASAADNCARIEAAISANEDFAEAALDGDDAALKTALRAIHESFAAIRKALPGKAAEQVEAAIAATEAAAKAGARPRAALAAVETYRVLVAELAPGEVAMLDHAGFKLRALAAAGTDWTAMAATVEDNARHAAAIKMDKALADLMGDINSGLKQAVAAKNPAWVDAEARILLDSVDLVEANQKPKACKQ